jgi:hypothetical protein
MDNDDKAFYESYIANFDPTEDAREALRQALTYNKWERCDHIILSAYGLWNDAFYKGSK